MTKLLIDRLTQRLDHMVPDLKVAKAVNDAAAAKLSEISGFLANALPDHSLSPEERLERLARVVQDRVPRQEQLLPAIQKVDRLERRLAELVPGEGMSAMDRLNRLVQQCNGMCGDDGKTLVQKLETLGDPRAGITPVA